MRRQSDLEQEVIIVVMGLYFIICALLLGVHYYHARTSFIDAPLPPQIFTDIQKSEDADGKK